MMNNISELGEKLTMAIDNKREFEKDNVENYESFIWKGEKVLNPETNKMVQESIRLIDATEEQLNKFFRHCHTMLKNESKQKPGRIPLLRILEDQRNRCAAELFLRNCEAKGTERLSILNALNTVILNNGLDEEATTLRDVVNDVEREYGNLSVKMVKDAILGKLGWFDRKHLTLSFIVRQGIWLSDLEKQTVPELFNKPVGERIKHLKSVLKLPEAVNLEFDPFTGLSITEMSSMLNLQSNKYSELTDLQLTTLCNKILLNLEDTVHVHIAQWNERLRQIRLIANIKNYDLTK